MSDENKLLSRLDVIESGLNDFTKSHKAELKASAEGVEKVKADIADIRKQNQEIAELVKSGISHADKPVVRMLGEAVLKAASEGTDGSGGYLVNDDLQTAIKSAQNQYGLVRQLFGAAIVPMQADVTKFPVDTFEDTDANAPIPTATSENAQISESNTAQLSQVTLTANKYATLNYISNELVDDSFVDYIGAYLLPKIARKAGKIEDTIVFTTASTGLLATSNVQVVNMVAGQTSFNNLSTDHFQDLEDAVVDDALMEGRYILHRSCLGLVRKLKGNDGHPIWTPFAGGDAPTINGYGYSVASIFPSKSASAVSTGFVLFGDITKGCVVGERMERKISVSDDFKFDYDQKAVRMTFRFAYATNANIGRAISVLKTAAV